MFVGCEALCHAILPLKPALVAQDLQRLIEAAEAALCRVGFRQLVCAGSLIVLRLVLQTAHRGTSIDKVTNAPILTS